MQDELLTMAEQLGKVMVERGHTLALAESCTGGWISQCITEVPGSSLWFDRGFITYSNSAKTEILGVREQTLNTHGAVSRAVAEEMVAGVLHHSGANLALAVTGIAGPGGGTMEKPVGLVFLAWQAKGMDCHYLEQHFEGGRHEIRYQTVRRALQCLLDESKLMLKST